MSQQEQKKEKKPHPPQYQRYLNGAFSGWIEVSLTHWIDVLKTKLQAEKELTANSSVTSISKRIWAEQGARGFYKGYISRMFGIGPMRAVFWGTMDQMNHLLIEKPWELTTKLVVAGVVGGAVQSVVDVPIEVAKTALITGSRDSASQLLKNAMKFHGAAATFSRNMIFAAIMNFGINFDRSPDASTAETMLRAGASGVIAAFLTQPLDYVKTKQQQSGQEFYKVNFIKLLADTGRKSLPLLWTGVISRASLSIATMSVSGTVFKILGRYQQPQLIVDDDDDDE